MLVFFISRLELISELFPKWKIFIKVLNGTCPTHYSPSHRSLRGIRPSKGKEKDSNLPNLNVESQPPVHQNVTLFEGGAFKEVIKLK